jgi:hypothetical protein
VKYEFRCTKCGTRRPYGTARIVAPENKAPLLTCEAKCGKGSVPNSPNVTMHEYVGNGAY